MDLVKGEWFDLYFQSTSSSRSQTGSGRIWRPISGFQSTSSSRSQTAKQANICPVSNIITSTFYHIIILFTLKTVLPSPLFFLFSCFLSANLLDIFCLLLLRTGSPKESKHHQLQFRDPLQYALPWFYNYFLNNRISSYLQFHQSVPTILLLIPHTGIIQNTFKYGVLNAAAIIHTLFCNLTQP